MTNAHSIKKVLITGISGSGGSYLAEYLVNNHPEVEVHGLSRWHSGAGDNLSALAGRIVVHESDLMDFGSVLRVLNEVKPDAIFHLAAHANVRASFINSSSVLANNIIGTSNLLEAVRLSGLNPIIQLASSSEVYGLVEPDEVPIKEETIFRPASPYAVSKAAQDLLGLVHFKSYGAKVIRTRMFTYVNPRRADLFATSFARQIARIEHGLGKELLHGNLDSIRTILDVRDAMRAYWEATLHCQAGEAYNIGGTTTISVGDFMNLLIQKSRVPISTRLDPSLLRPADVTLQIPNVDKFTLAAGWRPKHSFEETVDHLLNYWRQVVLKESPIAKV